MRVYTYDTATDTETPLVVTGGLERALQHAWALDVVRPPESDQWITVGLGNRLPREVALTVHVQATGGADAAHTLDGLRRAAEAADTLYITSESGDALAVKLAAFRGFGSPSPRGAYAYEVEARWIADRTLIAGPLVDVAGDTLTTDKGDPLMWEEEI